MFHAEEPKYCLELPRNRVNCWVNKTQTQRYFCGFPQLWQYTVIFISYFNTTSCYVTELQTQVPSVIILRVGRKLPHLKICPTCFSQMTFKHVQWQSTRENHATGSIPLLHLACLGITVIILLITTRSESQKQACRTWHLSWRTLLVLLHRILNLQLHCHIIF